MSLSSLALLRERRKKRRRSGGTEASSQVRKRAARAGTSLRRPLLRHEVGRGGGGKRLLLSGGGACVSHSGAGWLGSKGGGGHPRAPTTHSPSGRGRARERGGGKDPNSPLLGLFRLPPASPPREESRAGEIERSWGGGARGVLRSRATALRWKTRRGEVDSPHTCSQPGDLKPVAVISELFSQPHSASQERCLPVVRRGKEKSRSEGRAAGQNPLLLPPPFFPAGRGDADWEERVGGGGLFGFFPWWPVRAGLLVSGVNTRGCFSGLGATTPPRQPELGLRGQGREGGREALQVLPWSSA